MTSRVLAVLAVVLAFVAGCGGSKTDQSKRTSSSAPSVTASPQQSSPSLVIDVTIANGTVNPTNAEFRAKVGQPIQVRVNSDAVDELHVHSVPDHTFEVEAKPNQTFQFTVDVPGQVEVEVHKLDRTVGTIQVQQ